MCGRFYHIFKYVLDTYVFFRINIERALWLRERVDMTVDILRKYS